MIEIQVPELLQSLPENLSDVIKPWAERSPDRMALVETSGSWTYGQLDAVVKQTARGCVSPVCVPEIGYCWCARTAGRSLRFCWP